MKYKNSKASKTLFQPDRIPHVASLLFFLYFSINVSSVAGKDSFKHPKHICAFTERWNRRIIFK